MAQTARAAGESEAEVNPYHKIQTVFKRDPETKYKTLLFGDYSTAEFLYLQDNMWAFTEKVDGTNIRIMWDGTQRRFGGKTDRAQIPAKLIAVLEDMFPAKGFAATPEFNNEDGSPVEVCLYGEGFGAGIQKGGGNYCPEPSFVLFDVKVGKWWLRWHDVENVAIGFEIESVPLLGYGTLKDLVKAVGAGFNSAWGDFPAEGIVARPECPLFDRAGRRVITKLKCKDFTTQ
jgi:hypothetical protein